MSVIYKGENISGSSRQRCNRILIENPSNGNKVMEFFEEQQMSVTTANGIEVVNKPLGSIAEVLTVSNAAEIFNRIDRNSGTVIGTATYQDVYDFLFSLYMHVVTKRDLGTL